MRRGFMQQIGREDGAVAVLASVFMLVALGASALAVDIGSVVLEQREARKVADLAALDAVLVLSDRSGEFPDIQAGAEQLALESAANNDFVPGGARSLATEVGRWDLTARTFTPGIVAANAVRVTTMDTINHMFVPGTRQVTASAISIAENLAGIAIGTGLAELDSSESALLNPLLSGLLDTSLGLSAVHYNGLADLDVPVGLLSTYLGVGAGGIDELLLTDVSVASLAQAFADANPDSVGATADALGILAALNVPPASTAFPLGDILSVAAGIVNGDSVADAELNALTMLMAAAQAANRTNAIDLGTSIAIPGLANLNVKLGIIEAPQIAIGPARLDENGDWVTVARSAQVRLFATTEAPLNIAGLLGATIRVPLYVGTAEGSAALTANRCGNPTTPGQMTTEVATGGVTLRVAQANESQLLGGAHPTTPAHLVRLRANLLLTSVDVADVRAYADAIVAAGGGDLDFTGPFDWSNTQHLSATTNPQGLVLTNLNLWVDPLGLGSLVSIVTGALEPVIEPLVETLLNSMYTNVLTPVVGLLGADLAGADVTAWHQECGPRILVQ